MKKLLILFMGKLKRKKVEIKKDEDIEEVAEEWGNET